ncbi:hypothetical protein [Maribacter sp. ACAM166]|nr:hypothetical protein [Maribacter sp. ACAM166]
MLSAQEVAQRLQRALEFQSTHADPENRIEKRKEAIEKHKNEG